MGWVGWERINNCKNCGGYGYYRYFDGGGDGEIKKCEVCKAKLSKGKVMPKEVKNAGKD